LHEKRLSGKKHLAKQTIGFIGIAAILLSAVLNPSAQLLAYGIAGFWISFLWPIIFEKVIRHG
jgi:hypothetical protein